MGSPRREKKGAKPRAVEDREAILRRRQFLVESALAGVGLGLAATGQALASGAAPAPPPAPWQPPPGVCLSVVAPRPCLTPPPPPMPPLEMQVRTLQDPAGAFSVCIPGDWQNAPTSAGIAATAPGGQAGVQVATVPRPAGPIDRAFHELRVGWQQQVPGWTLQGWSLTRIGGTLAVVCRGEAQPGGTPTVGDYVIVDRGQSLVVCSAWCLKEALPRWQPTLFGICVSLQVRPGRPPYPEPCLVPPQRKE